MKRLLECWAGWIVLLVVGFTAPPGWAGQAPPGPLVGAAWLQQQLGAAAAERPAVLDASPGSVHREGHIPGSVPVDLFTFGMSDLPQTRLQSSLRRWGVNAGQTIVIVDEGASYQAARLYWDLLHAGLPASQLRLLDGGMAKWRAEGGAVSIAATPAPTPGTLQLGAVEPSVRVRLPEFLAASGDPRRSVLLEALDPEYYYGGAAFLNRGGHVPHARLMPSGDFFNADKTFKSPAEIRRMLAHLGIAPGQEVLTYCGGGGAAAVPFFALKALLGEPRVRMFQESQMGWLLDERELPLWSYGAPQMLRDAAWVKTWGGAMMRMFNITQVSIVDLRPADAYRSGHLPLALNLPAAGWLPLALPPDASARPWAQLGVPADHEVVLMDEGGLTGPLALAYLVLEQQGQRKVSLLLDGVDRWAERGYEVAGAVAPGTAAPAAGSASGPAVSPAPVGALNPVPAGSILRGAQAGGGKAFETVYLTSGPLPTPAPWAAAVGARSLHLPSARLLRADGMPRPAHEIWKLLADAGVPRYAELVFHADDAGAAAINAVLFKLMGFADVKLWLP